MTGSGVALMPARRKSKRAYHVVSRSQKGGFALPAIAAVHSALQTIKPVTNGIALAKSLGVADKINKVLSKNAVGRALKSVGSFAQSKLGYGSKRVGRPRKVGRPQKVGGSKSRRKRH